MYIKLSKLWKLKDYGLIFVKFNIHLHRNWNSMPMKSKEKFWEVMDKYYKFLMNGRISLMYSSGGTSHNWIKIFKFILNVIGQ